MAAADDDYVFSWQAATLLIRELCILRVIEELTNKSDWWLKVNDEEIAKKWRQEALEMDYKAILGAWAIVTPAMADAVSRTPFNHRHHHLLVTTMSLLTEGNHQDH